MCNPINTRLVDLNQNTNQVTRLSADAWCGDGWQDGAINDYGERPTIDFAYAGPFRCAW
jgi:hypothetical protein